MASVKLGRLERLDLRDVWTNEAGDFTPWLASEENLKLLGETIGLELDLEAQEKDVGPFRADILCKDTASNNWVLIENQLERTDHTHLGQLLTYAAGLEAVTIVWIAEQFTEEHRATLDWLNEITDERFTFFGLEIEVWKIGDSDPAPKFNLVSKPNDWSRAVQRSAAAAGELSEARQAQLAFWIAFKAYMDDKSKIRCTKPSPSHVMAHPVGRSGFWLNSVASVWDSATSTKTPEIRVDFVIGEAKAKTYYEALERQKDDIERELGFPLVWHNPSNARMCRMYVRRPGDFTSKDEWPALQEWLRQNLELFHKVFSPRVKRLGAPSTSDNGGDDGRA